VRLRATGGEVVHEVADSDEQQEDLALRQELEHLRERARQAEEEVGVLRRRLSEGPGRVQSLE
jgi:hypothetical protein